MDGNCTAFLIQTPGAGPAYALTAGHCVARGANDVLVDRAVSGRTVVFQFFADTRDRQVAVPVHRIAYSTMKGRDLAVLELAATSAELAGRGLRAWELAASEPPAGTAIAVVGAPASFFDAREWFLRRADCTVGERAQLLEFIWHFWDVRRNDCADMVGGFSGSPVLAGGQVMGVLNTTTYLAWQGGGDFDCYLGRPCELTRAGAQVEEDTSYSTPVTGLLECFTADGVFALERAACPLDRGRQLTVTRRFRTQQPGGTWAAALAGEAAFYRWKSVTAGEGECRDEAGYSVPLTLAAHPLIEDAMPWAEARYLLCVVAEGQPVRDATVVTARVDETPPVIRERYTVRDEGAVYRVAMEFAPPELSGYFYKTGPPAETRCDVPGYAPYRRVPVVLPKTGGPYRFCLYAEDEAGNTSPAIGFVLGGGPVVLPGGVANAFSGVAGRMAPGGWISLYGVALDEGPIRLRDGAGRVWEFTEIYRSAEQVNARVPVGAALGRGAVLTAASEEPLELVAAAPGVHSAVERGDEITVFATGLAQARGVTARLGTLTLALREAQATPSGIDVLRFAWPPDHGLRGRQFLYVMAGGEASGRVAVMIQ